MPANDALKEERVGKSFHFSFFTFCDCLLHKKYLLKVRGDNVFIYQNIIIHSTKLFYVYILRLLSPNRISITSKLQGDFVSNPKMVRAQLMLCFFITLIYIFSMLIRFEPDLETLHLISASVPLFRINICYESVSNPSCSYNLWEGCTIYD